MYDYIFNTGTHVEIVWRCQERFVSKGKMPYFLDVEIEFILRKLLCDLMPFTHWFYSFGKLCRFILTYYFFDNNMDGEIKEYLETTTEEERTHYQDYYDNQPPIVGAVYI